MTIKLDIHDVPGGARVGVKLLGLQQDVHTEIPVDDAVRALEDLARILGYTLVDEQERRSLQELVAESDGEQSGSAADQAVLWRALARELTEAVRSALRFDTPGEV